MEEATKTSVYATLNSINVNDNVEQKNGLTYLSWAWAWAKVKEHFPDSIYTIYENANGWFYHTDGNTAWVKTGVTINGIEHIEYLPVMDNRNRSIPVASLTSFDVNKAIQRSLTKACARHGLGLYIYAGEDLPEGEAQQRKAEAEAVKQGRNIDDKTIAEVEALMRQQTSIEAVRIIYRKYPAFKDALAHVGQEIAEKLR